jgi:8-oxo-dGTP diphosphatase
MTNEMLRIDGIAERHGRPAFDRNESLEARFHRATPGRWLTMPTPNAVAIVPHIRVVAALIERHGQYLITQRSSTAVLAGLWEFPGCKVEAGETDEAALRRELLGRVAIDVDVGAAAASRTHSYDGYHVDLIVYRATIPSSQEPQLVRTADLRWVKPQELENYPFPSADQGTTDLLLGISRDHRCMQTYSVIPGVSEILSPANLPGDDQGDRSHTKTSPGGPS